MTMARIFMEQAPLVIDFDNDRFAGSNGSLRHSFRCVRVPVGVAN